MDTFKGKRVTVMGLGRFGGGLGAARWLAGQGAEVLVTDLAAAEKLAEPLEEIRPLVESGQVKLRLGEHQEGDFTGCDLVVANPAVPKPWENRFLKAATATGVPITTEIRLLVERLPNRERVIGVTGSAGKSTTSAMIQHLLARLGESAGRRVHLGGNIGVSLLEELPGIGSEDWVVLELSSFMLYWLGADVGYKGAAGWSPAIGVLTNITANHLDWHGGGEHYVQSKLGIWRYARGATKDGARPLADAAVWNDRRARVSELEGAVEPFLKSREDEIFTQAWAYRDRIPAPMAEPVLRIPGGHNIENAETAMAAVNEALMRDREADPGAKFDMEGIALQVRRAAMVRALSEFGGLPHRLQFAGEVRGVRYFNDSKCTTPEAALLAVKAFAEDPAVGAGRVHLIAGGYDKGSDLTPIGRLAGTLGGLYTVGLTGPVIAMEAGGKAVECGTLERAVGAAAERAKPGDVVLLSPACASWDQYINYEFRGEAFCALVRAMGAS